VNPTHPIVASLAREGVDLWADGDRLRFRSAAPLMPGQLERLAKNKPAIMRWLATPAGRLHALSASLADPDAAAEVHDRFDELAGLYQHDAGMSRDEAEEQAVDTIERMRPTLNAEAA
jgi:hypothetical protein